MQIYRVGGAVRDRLLGLPVTDTDWVVVGATPEQMLAHGFRQVGRDFPVFLHPQSKEEYALARTERKRGRGYTAFEVHADPQVTLEQDLARRDLTINAMAEDSEGHIIDPYHGRRDLDHKLLRHVTPAFAEDPLRVLRVARFAARFFPLGFSIAEETMALMKTIVDAGEMEALVAERVWTETARALGERDPVAYFDVLEQCGALLRLLPELAKHYRCGAVPARALLAAVAADTERPEVRFAALVCALSETALAALADRLRLPGDYCQLGSLCSRHLESLHAFAELTAVERLQLLEVIDALRRRQRLDALLTVARRHWLLLHPEANDYPQAAALRDALAALTAVDVQALVAAGYQGAALAGRLREQRIAAIAAVVAD